VLQSEVRGITAASPKASGSLPSHYAPRAKVELVSPDALLARARELAEQGAKVGVLTAAAPQIDSKNIILLMIHGNETDFAKVLYDRLRTADELGCDVVLTTLPAELGLGTAIADRLRRAAGPRPKG